MEAHQAQLPKRPRGSHARSEATAVVPAARAMPVALVGDMCAPMSLLREEDLWVQLRRAARSEAARALATLRSLVERHVGGGGDLHKEDLSVLQLLVTLSFVAHHGWVRPAPGGRHGGSTPYGLTEHGDGAAEMWRSAAELTRRREQTYLVIRLPPLAP